MPFYGMCKELASHSCKNKRKTEVIKLIPGMSCTNVSTNGWQEEGEKDINGPESGKFNVWKAQEMTQPSLLSPVS